MPFRFSSLYKRPDIINDYKIPLPSKPTVFTRFRKIFSKTRSFRAAGVEKVKTGKQKRKKETDENPWDRASRYCMLWGWVLVEKDNEARNDDKACEKGGDR